MRYGTRIIFNNFGKNRATKNFNFLKKKPYDLSVKSYIVLLRKYLIKNRRLRYVLLLELILWFFRSSYWGIYYLIIGTRLKLFIIGVIYLDINPSILANDFEVGMRDQWLHCDVCINVILWWVLEFKSL